MKYVIFSDIHGNSMALKKMLTDTELFADKYIFLGDIFGYYNNPEECIDILMNMENLVSIKGNHDNNYLCSDDKIYFSNLYGVSYLKKIDDVKQKWLNNLENYFCLTSNGHNILFVHGSADDHLNGRIYPDTKVSAHPKFDIVFSGHTHYQMDRFIHKTRYLNPGSLGQPRDGKGYSYLVYDDENDICRFCAVNINKDLLLLNLKKTETNAELVKYLQEKD